ncbi:hypothetical protein RJT34_12989 [Clitoria ternatea]|uniref:Uncharacterized protein n=1 Tax=Clitoria ternatea TaxID=43366 RepID=A0AAN9JRA5_CLITE
MDPDISRWIMEFLLRTSVPDSLIQKTLTALPLSAADSRLKRTLLLRILQSHLLKASLSETTLQILELLEHLNRTDALPVPDSMRRAYCTVAVECTVKFLAASPDDPSGEYLAAVRRIWRGRVANLAAEGRRSELISGELTRWRDDVDAALWDPRVRKRLASLNSRREALNEVGVFLQEAWELMGPTFLDSVAAMSKGLCPERVCQFALGGEVIGKREVGLEGSRTERRDSVGGGYQSVNGNDNFNNDDDDDNSNGDDAYNDEACCMEDGAVQDENQGRKQLEERVEENEEVGRSDLHTQRDKGDTRGAIQKGNPLLKPKHSALRACHRGVKISIPEEVEPIKSWSKYQYMSSVEVGQIRESLKSSSADLRALVKDPLHGALRTSEVIRSKLATKDTNIKPHIDNESERGGVPDPDVCKSIILFQPNDANHGKRKKTSDYCSNFHHPNLMKQRSSVRTFEFGDSIDNSPQGRQARRRKRKWTSLEEETLRAGVKLFGEGNWATIRNFYSNIFENRSGVDLKDKWRNMMR